MCRPLRLLSPNLGNEILSLLLYSVGTQVNPGSLWEGCTHACAHQGAGILGAVSETACHALPAPQFLFPTLTLWALLPLHPIYVAWHDGPSAARPALQSRGWTVSSFQPLGTVTG